MIADWLDEVMAAQLGDGITKCPDPRKNKVVRLANFLGRSGDGGLVANSLEGLLHAAKVPHAIIDNRNHCSSN